MTAVLFLAALLFTVLGVCCALAVLNHAGQITPAHLRHAGLLLVLAFTGVAGRGRPWQWAAVVPLGVAVWLTYRFVRRARTHPRHPRHLRARRRSSIGSGCSDRG